MTDHPLRQVTPSSITLTPLQRLTRFAQDMGTFTDRTVIAERILFELCDATSSHQGALYLLDREHDQYERMMTLGMSNSSTAFPSLASAHPLIQSLAREHHILSIADVADIPPITPKLAAALQAVHSSLAIPLLNKSRLIAVALLGIPSGRPLDHADGRDLLTALAQSGANALDSILVNDDLHQSQTLMRRTDRLRSLEIIAGGFAHEIRNPLTSIKTFIQLAPERKDDSEFIHDFSRIVLDDVHRIERLIQEILDYARYMEPKLTDEDLNEIVTSCLYFIEVKADSKRIKIEKQLASELPRVMLDRQQIKQVLLNLLLNAIDAMGDGGGQLRVRTHRITKPGTAVWTQIEIEDSGPGISKVNLEHIFDPFFTTKHTSGEHAGTGLGLTIVHQIIQEHHGEIQVESTEGVGTTFSVNLPALPID
ncbi:ATP-binding protein [Nitrospira lenta]|uniref:histidine kinase n=1 Tax=Nitrospira lenta TaxID=1436998 RepID=A0A330L9W5_9BACT